ncbi:PEPxxWA-CTERM sorting domain-containing protein [Phenylobacterium sp.]|jgi:hypothetical protein|uniref:PEPxxWA-CTERM sorting domain-containing protein n=1 Tax=Phenylobacterium sp. TaxID=1871053 RepID=UPI002E373862|nr:PEPxxWA-CTERM sorting domain-containing protein [Phenylobacterium sp.]HEX3367287.1 PEPxxWA-CTERM sorting domain-containing protein [Phenylobacterium sp.]
MKMKLFAAAAVAVGFLAVAGSASATTIITQGGETLAIDAVATPFTPTLTGSGMTMIDNFDSISPAFGFTVSGGTLATGTSGTAAAPPGDATQYEAVETDSPFTITDTLGSLTRISFYMGSPDATDGLINRLSVTVNGGLGPIVLTGTDIWGGPGNQVGDGNQNDGFLITYTFSPQTVHSLTFSQSGGPAFEFDNLAAAIPEPASWALMIGGFGLAGASLRAKRRQAATA